MIEGGDFLREDFREFVELLVIEQCEGLERRVGTDAARAGAEAVGGIENGERWMRRGTPEMSVESAAVALFAGAGFPGAFHLAEVHDAVGLRRVDGRATEFRGEQTARGEGDIADDFGIEAQAVLAREQFVDGVDLGEFGADAG